MSSSYFNFLQTASIQHIHVSLIFIRIPRSRLPQLIHPVLTQLLKPNPMFISITYNSIELTLIVEESARNDFERLQTNSINHSEGFLSPDDIQISPTTWVPLSIDVSQSDRLRDISEPLAKAGISILYHSAMNNDYLFVESLHLSTVLDVLAHSGFVLLEEEEGYISPGSTQYSHSWQADSPLRARVDPPPLTITKPPPAKPSSLTQFAPVRILPHTVAFHGLNLPDRDDSWILKIIKLLGWPNSIIPPKPRLTVPVPMMYHPRPKHISRHSEDRNPYRTSSPSRSRSTSFPNPHPIASSPRAPTWFRERAGTSPSPFIPDSPIQSNIEPLPEVVDDVDVMPFFSFTRRAGQMNGDPPEITIMARGKLLAQLFDSTSLIGGSGDIATSDIGEEEFYTEHSASKSNIKRFKDDEGFKCLQIDLQSFGIGEHGLVARFAQTLADNGIRHHYASTYNSANLLVSKANAIKARNLLQALEL